MDNVVPSVRVAPLAASYTYRSPIPDHCVGGSGARRVPCVLGVDEAGRGPVLGTCRTHHRAARVWHRILPGGPAGGAAQRRICRYVSSSPDSKTLTPERRDALLAALREHHASMGTSSSHAGWAVRVMSPQDISAGMLRRRPHNLNAQSCDATVLLIQGVLDSGVDVTKVRRMLIRSLSTRSASPAHTRACSSRTSHGTRTSNGPSRARRMPSIRSSAPPALRPK